MIFLKRIWHHFLFHKRLKALIAFVSRSFVTDCPHCHKHFFGFHPYRAQVRIGKVHYRFVCHQCVKKHLQG